MPSSGGRGRRYLTQWELTRMLEVVGRTPSVVSALTVRAPSLDERGTTLRWMRGLPGSFRRRNYAGRAAQQ